MAQLDLVTERDSMMEHRDPGCGSDPASPFVEALQRLAPLLRERRDAFDKLRRLPDEVFEALADAGLFRLWLPKAIGGPELSPFEFMRVVETASAIDGSVGWLIGNGGGMSRAGGYVSQAVARDWFADPRGFVAAATGATGTATPVKGGYRVTGRWPFGSGAHHASRFMVLATEAPEAPTLCCYVARKDVTIVDNWHVLGLRGTGSCDFELHDVFVPQAHMHPFLDFKPSDPGLVYRISPGSIFPWSISAVPLGIARGAIDAFVEHASRKGPGAPASLRDREASLRDREAVQATVGRAEAMHRAARAGLVEAMTELVAAMEIGGERLATARAMFRVAPAYATETTIGIIDMLAACAGSASIFETCPIERAVRDVRAAARHVALAPGNYIVAGRAGLGLDLGTSRS